MRMQVVLFSLVFIALVMSVVALNIPSTSLAILALVLLVPTIVSNLAYIFLFGETGNVRREENMINWLEGKHIREEYVTAENILLGTISFWVVIVAIWWFLFWR